jgi:hypothetical protein
LTLTSNTTPPDFVLLEVLLTEIHGWFADIVNGNDALFVASMLTL